MHVIKKYKKIGNWDIRLVEWSNGTYHLEIMGEIYSENPTIYNDYTVGYDFPERLPKNVIKYIDDNAFRIKNDINLLNSQKNIKVKGYVRG